MNKIEESAEPRRPSADLDKDLALVKRVASTIHRQLKLDGVVELEELVQYGWLGLLDAQERLDPSTDPRFFFYMRVRGGIFDGLRKLARLPRRAHQLLRMAERTDQLEAGGNLKEALSAHRFALRNFGFIVTQTPYSTHVPTPDSYSPEELTLQKQRAERLRQLVDELPEPDREVTRRHLFHEEPIAEIAKDLQMDRTWTWRIFDRATRNLKFSLTAEL